MPRSAPKAHMSPAINKVFKIGLWALGILAFLFVVLLAIIAITVDPNSYKPQIVQLVQDQKQRTLTLEGNIKLKLFPRLGLDLGKTQLSEHQGNATFAALDSVKLYVAWLPLLRRELVVDKVSIEGLRANLVRNADGSTNFDDLMSKSESDWVKFDVHGVEVTRSALRFDDKQAKRVFAITDFNLHSGRLKEDTHTHLAADFKASSDHPQLNAAIKLQTGLRFVLAAKHYELDGLDATASGEAFGLRQLVLSVKGDIDANAQTPALGMKALKAELSGVRGPDKFQLALSTPALQLDRKQAQGKDLSLTGELNRASGPLSLQLSLPEIQGNDGKFAVQALVLEIKGKQNAGQITGKLSSPLTGNLNKQTLSLDKLAGDLTVTGAQAKKTMHIQLSGSAQADIVKQSLSAKLASRLDESNLRADIGMRDFARPAYQFDVDIDQIDLDKYWSASSSTSKPHKPADASAESSMDFSALKDLNANGRIKIGQLKFSNVKSSNVRLEFKAANGKVEANPVSANLYHGVLQGSASLTTSASPQFALQQNLRSVSVGPLVRDWSKHDVLEGRGNISMQLNAHGTTTRALTQILRGNAALNLEDGSIKGVNLAAIARKAKAALNMQAGGFAQAGNANEKTDFSEMKASFTLRDGVAHNDDLSAKSPLLRLSGKGDIDLNRATLDYLVRATLVGSLEGQGGKDSSQLKGVTLPIRVAGAFDALHYSFDAGAMLAETAKSQLEQHKEVLQQKAQDKIREHLGDQLKGLFGR